MIKMIVAPNQIVSNHMPRRRSTYFGVKPAIVFS
jgi:hypothetical protein